MPDVLYQNLTHNRYCLQSGIITEGMTERQMGAVQPATIAADIERNDRPEFRFIEYNVQRSGTHIPTDQKRKFSPADKIRRTPEPRMEPVGSTTNTISVTENTGHAGVNTMPRCFLYVSVRTTSTVP